MKRLLLILLSIILMTMLIGCSKNTNTSSTTKTTGSKTSTTATINKSPTIGIETKGDGTGIAVNIENMVVNRSITLYSIYRDGNNNFISNPTGSWSLIGSNNILFKKDLVTSKDGKSAVFTPTVTGSVVVHLTSNRFIANAEIIVGAK